MLDTIHGGATIAQRMVDAGIEAQALEVYHHCPGVSGFDLVVAPVHLSPENPTLAEARRLGKKILTHHQAVGELLLPSLSSDLEVFEVTGTHSKTSTALLMAMMLSFKKRVLSHTTRGLELWSGGSCQTLQRGLSITPANVLRAFYAACDHDVEGLICEVSLGGTGLADYGILTSLSGDYRIAAGSKWASTAKLQMVSLAKKSIRLVINSDAKISADQTFGHGGRVWANKDRLYFGAESLSLRLGEDLDFASYQTAISASSAAAWEAGLSPEEITSSLEGFEAFSGRMKIIHEDGLTVYDSSNSGLKLSDVGRVLDRARGKGLGLVVGEEAETVCEGMDISGLVELLRRRRDEIRFLVLVGERLRPWAEPLGAKMAGDLASGLEMAIANSDDLEKLLLCVKCFR